MVKSKVPVLVKPSVELEKEYMAFADEFQGTREAGLTGYVRNLVGKDFALFVESLEKEERGENLRQGFVPQTTCWLVGNRGQILGESHLRHFLTPDLEIEGGHIGCLIRPSQRRKGYGTLLLAHTLEKARAMGLKSVLITCYTDNKVSVHVIRKNGGKLLSEGISPRNGKFVSRFRIEL